MPAPLVWVCDRCEDVEDAQGHYKEGESTDCVFCNGTVTAFPDKP